MKFLLDTNVILRMDLEPKTIGKKSAALLTNPTNDLLISVISAWEIVIKSRIGKLKLPLDAASYVRSCISNQKLTLLECKLDHVLAVANLPPHHADPFDRLLVAQAIVEELAVVSADRRLSAYGVKTIDLSK